MVTHAFIGGHAMSDPHGCKLSAVLTNATTIMFVCHETPLCGYKLPPNGLQSGAETRAYEDGGLSAFGGTRPIESCSRNAGVQAEGTGSITRLRSLGIFPESTPCRDVIKSSVDHNPVFVGRMQPTGTVMISEPLAGKSQQYLI